jgi:hypothetical protein
MSEKTVSDLQTFVTPFRRQEIKLQDASHESGLKMLQIRVREGQRFTILEIDAKTAKALGTSILEWAEEVS